MDMDRATRLAYLLLRDDPASIADAEAGAPRGNSVVGAVLTRPFGPLGSRELAEAAVLRALALLRQEREATK